MKRGRKRKRNLKCPRCGEERVVKAGLVPSLTGSQQRYQCRSCGRTFYKRELTSSNPLVLFHEESDPNLKLRKRYMELAGMFKEKKKGTNSSLQRILQKFKVQMGVKDSTVRDYLNTLIGTGLVVLSQGSGKWFYNENEEWDLFQINI